MANILSGGICLLTFNMEIYAKECSPEILGCDPIFFHCCVYTWVIISSSWLTNVDGMKDLWCSSTVRLLQHRHE